MERRDRDCGYLKKKMYEQGALETFPITTILRGLPSQKEQATKTIGSYIKMFFSEHKKTSVFQVLQGHYRILGSGLSLVLKRRSRERQINRRKGRRYRGGTTDVAETVFQIVSLLASFTVSHYCLLFKHLLLKED